jgi:hypothetical protein
MKFFVIEDFEGKTIDCFLSEAKAIEFLETDSYFGELGFNSIVEIECPVNSETIRALLSGQGGYATSIRRMQLEDYKSVA